MKKENKKLAENNPQTGLQNVFRENKVLPEEAGDQLATPIAPKPFKDRGNLGKEGNMEKKYQQSEGADTIDGESPAVP